MVARGIGALIRRSPRFFSLRRIASPSSAASSAASVNPSFRFSTGAGSNGGEVYRHALTFKKPTAVVFRREMYNRVSLIGLVDRDVRVLDTEPGYYGVFTLLRVKHPRDTNRSFRVFIHMWDEMARSCIAHLKPNDLIYISGNLVSHSKAFESGNCGLDYQVKVIEMNYVVCPRKALDIQASGESKPETGSGEDRMEWRRNRLYLWQVFFANPYEWWDNRKGKKNPRQPDFKHKDTGEALWLKPGDPHWVKRQLQLLDSRLAESGNQARSHLRVSEWVYDE